MFLRITFMSFYTTYLNIDNHNLCTIKNGKEYLLKNINNESDKFVPIHIDCNLELLSQLIKKGNTPYYWFLDTPIDSDLLCMHLKGYISEDIIKIYKFWDFDENIFPDDWYLHEAYITIFKNLVNQYIELPMHKAIIIGSPLSYLRKILNVLIKPFPENAKVPFSELYTLVNNMVLSVLEKCCNNSTMMYMHHTHTVSSINDIEDILQTQLVYDLHHLRALNHYFNKHYYELINWKQPLDNEGEEPDLLIDDLYKIICKDLLNIPLYNNVKA